MKKLLINIFKTLFFFDLAVIIIFSRKPFNLKNAAYSFLAQNAFNFAVVAVLTLVFCLLVEKQKGLKKQKPKKDILSIITGAACGMAVPLICVTVSVLFKNITFAGVNKLSNALIWALALFASALAFEMLFRGYLFKIYKRDYGFITATVVTTLLYISTNLEIFDMPKIYVANILLMNIFLCMLVEITGSVAASVTARFVYTVISTMLLGSYKTGAECPKLFNCLFRENSVLSGGVNGIEGSAVTTVVLSVMLIIFINQKYSLLKTIGKKSQRKGKTVK